MFTKGLLIYVSLIIITGTAFNEIRSKNVQYNNLSIHRSTFLEQMYLNKHNNKNQLGPRYEGQLIFMTEPIPHPKRPPRAPSQS